MRSVVGVLKVLVARQRTAIALAVLVALTSSGTALAVTYLALGTTNTSGATTTLRSSVNGAVLQLTNNNGSSGTNARALGITVPAGRAPITVNAIAGKATNLNADKLDGQDASAFLPVNGQAANANLLDGLDSSEFLPSNGTAANANLIDGLDSTALFRGGGSIESGALAEEPGQFLVVIDTGHIRIAYACPGDLATNGVLRLRNVSGETVNYFSDNGGANPNQFGSLGPNDVVDQGAAAGGEHISFQAQGTFIANVEVYSIHRVSDTTCHIQAQAVVDLP